jgi:ABC-type transport system substrate-binding protein
MGLTAIDTPDATTIVFHLKAPFSDMDYLLTIPQSAPVPPDKDTAPATRRTSFPPARTSSRATR